MGSSTVSENSAANPLGTRPIPSLIAKFAVPSCVSLVVNSIYNMVDQIFIGQGVGYLGNAATNVITPLMTLTVAIALWLGDGAASYMSLMLGNGQPKKAAKGIGNAITLVVICGVAMTILCSIFLRPLCWLFGATESNISYCIDYGSGIAVGFWASMICGAFASMLRADGRPGVSMVGLLIGCATNLICDPIFIFVFGWGVKGAAFATILGQIFNAIFDIVCVLRFKTIKLTKDCFKLSWDSCSKILRQGLSSFITQAAVVVVMIVTNNLLVIYGEASKYGPDIPLAVYGIVMKFNMLLMGIIQGVATGCQPIWGYNYGSGQYDRVKQCFKISMIVCEIVACAGFVIFQAFPKQLISLFGSESDLYVEFAVMCFRIFLLGTFIIPWTIAVGIFFQAIGKPLRAAFLSLSRQIIFLIPAMLIFGAIGGLQGVLWGGPFADIGSGIVGIIMVIYSWKRIFKTGGTQNG